MTTTGNSPRPLLGHRSAYFLAGVFSALWTIFLGGLAEHYDLWSERIDPLLLFFWSVFLSGTTVSFLLLFLTRGDSNAM